MLVVALVLVSGAIDMVASLPTPIMVGATSYRFDKVMDNRCSSASDVCCNVGLCQLIDDIVMLLL